MAWAMAVMLALLVGSGATGPGLAQFFGPKTEGMKVQEFKLDNGLQVVVVVQCKSNADWLSRKQLQDTT